MNRYDYCIIGGGIAGVTAAETIRQADPHGTIALISDEPHILYSRVLLPAYLKGNIRREQLFLRTIDQFTKNRIDVRLNERVMRVDTSGKEIWFSPKSSLGYGKLLIAAGGSVRPWGKPEDQDHIYRLQTLDDAERLKQALPHIKSALVIGASFISLEFLSIFSFHGISQTLLARDPYFFSQLLDPRGAELLSQVFEEQHISMQFGDEVAEIKQGVSGVHIATKNLRTLEADGIAAGVGIERNTSVFRESGLKIGEKGVIVNEFLETNSADVFSAGDIAEQVDSHTGEVSVAGNWTHAFLQGKQAGLNMTGSHTPFTRVTSYSVTHFGMQITALGDCQNHTEAIAGIDIPNRAYRRFCIQDGVLKGAILINKPHDSSHLALLIENKKNISSYGEQLKDVSFDVRTIPVL